MEVVTRPVARRGEVWFVELDPTVGRKIQKTRPCLIVSPDIMNRYLDTITIVPLTSGGKPLPFRVGTRFDDGDGLFLADQMRTVDRHRLRGKAGMIERQTLSRALAVLREMFEE